jgi:hypothetical protein
MMNATSTVGEYLEGLRMSRQPKQRDFLDGDYGPQADRGFGVAGHGIGVALHCFYMLVSFSETR